MNIVNKHLLLLLLVTHCTSNGIVDRLESPSGSSRSGSDRLYAFVSPSTAIGSMGAFSNGNCSGGGTAQADCACTDWAQAGNLKRSSTSKFVAWLSTPSSHMSCRLLGNSSGINCSFPSSSPTWYRPDGQVVANGWQNLFGSIALANPINMTHTKVTIASGAVWTGTTPFGLPTGTDCTGWTPTGTATTGDLTQTGANWTQASTGSCGNANFIYCFAVP